MGDFIHTYDLATLDRELTDKIVSVAKEINRRESIGKPRDEEEKLLLRLTNLQFVLASNLDSDEFEIVAEAIIQTCYEN